MSKWFSAFALFVFAFFPLISALPVSAATDDTVLINEIRLGGSDVHYIETSVKEYVTLYNGGAEPVDLNGWVLEYAKNATAELDTEFCQSSSWQGFVGVKISEQQLSGTLAPGSVSSPIVIQLNDSGSGSLRLLDASKPDSVVVQDLVGWGADAPCKEQVAAVAPTAGKSLYRFLACVGEGLVDSNNNSADFVSNQFSAPGMTSETVLPSCTQESTPSDCKNVTITEVLPNPSGADGGNEFIELHNPTDKTVSLEGCQLGLSGSAKVYDLSGSLAVNDYLVLFDHKTGLTLPNAAGGEVLFIGGDGEVPFTYPGNLKDDESWALLNGGWEATNNPTPGSANKAATTILPDGKGGDEELAPCAQGKFRNPETNRCKNVASITSSLTPCAPGKTRNPETNRCRSTIELASSLLPCKPGQTRNPETNRCRSTVASANALTPCKPGQTRNPETNRCRSTLAATSSLKPCGEGEERNAETNRCRKVASALSGASIADKTDEGKSKVNYGLLGLVGASALSYGVYEYRNDFRNKFANLKSRFFPGKTGE